MPAVCSPSGIGAPGLGSPFAIAKVRQSPRLLLAARAIGFARNTDVIAASVTVPLTLIWIKHREIGAQVGCTWCSLQMEKADEICHKGCPCSFVLRVCGNALPRLVWTRRHLTVSRERPGTGRPPADARERCGCRAPTYAAGCVRRWDHRCRRDRHGRRDRYRTLLWWSGRLFRWSLRGLRLPRARLRDPQWLCLPARYNGTTRRRLAVPLPVEVKEAAVRAAFLLFSPIVTQIVRRRSSP